MSDKVNRDCGQHISGVCNPTVDPRAAINHIVPLTTEQHVVPAVSDKRIVEIRPIKAVPSRATGQIETFKPIIIELIIVRINAMRSGVSHPARANINPPNIVVGVGDT
ncbi:MAG: hypothetical protein CSA70_11735 [Rhodobacterales bacterium]|nr:MAG: hypothetical protein CR984_01315 [Pseudomonadota bacterium]PIE10675.1 MAG: hypothetical protein CSA70_11735 [Rhodobacterales bacterium]